MLSDVKVGGLIKFHLLVAWAFIRLVRLLAHVLGLIVLSLLPHRERQNIRRSVLRRLRIWALRLLDKFT